MTSPSDSKALVEALERIIDVGTRTESHRIGDPWSPGGWEDYEVVSEEAEIARQALASISSREEDEDEGITQLADDPRVQEALRYLEARNFVLVNRQSDDPTPVRQLIAGRLSAPATQAEREAVATVLISYDDHTDWPVALEIAGEILSLLESRRTTPDPRPLTALLTRWDNGESVGDLITQYLRGEGDWGPVRVLVGATTRSPSTLPDGWRGRVKTALREHHRRVYNEYGAFWFDGELDQMADAIGEVFGGLGSVACSAEPSLASRVSSGVVASPSPVGQSDIHYIEAALSYYCATPAQADVQSAWRRIKDACGYTGAGLLEGVADPVASDGEGRNGREATGGRPNPESPTPLEKKP